MQCREFEERLQLAVDFRRDPSEEAELDGHAAVCADCSAKREWFSALARMTDAFRASPAQGSAGDYDRSRLIRKTLPLVAVGDVAVAEGDAVEAQRTEEVVLAAPVEPVRRRSRWLLAGSGLAVAAGVALFVTLAFLPWSPPAGNDEVAVNSSTSDVAEEGAQTDNGPAVVAPDVVAVASIGSDSQSPADRALSLEGLRASLTSSLPSDPPMTGSLRPIATSFGVAWETVRSALPNARPDAGPGQDQADVRGFQAVVTA